MARHRLPQDDETNCCIIDLLYMQILRKQHTNRLIRDKSIYYIHVLLLQHCVALWNLTSILFVSSVGDLCLLRGIKRRFGCTLFQPLSSPFSIKVKCLLNTCAPKASLRCLSAGSQPSTAGSTQIRLVKCRHYSTSIKSPYLGGGLGAGLAAAWSPHIVAHCSSTEAVPLVATIRSATR